MIISQTPFRVSFSGGGTDLASFYREEYGAVFSVALNHHMYVTIHKRFEDDIRVSYSKTDLAINRESVQHDLVRETMRMTNVDEPLEITTIADVPSGTGLGSSSTLTVGLLNALRAHAGTTTDYERLASMACEIEIDTLQNPIGKQDQYAAAFGGMNYITFNPDETVSVDRVPCKPETLRRMEDYSLMVYTNQQRSASAILAKQTEGTASKLSTLREMRDMAAIMRDICISGAPLDDFGRLLHEGWLLKRSLGFGITNPLVDEWYEAARTAGALGGKLLGAGGGGFLFLVAPPEKHAGILSKLGNPKTLPVRFDPHGSRIVFISG